MKRLRDFLNRPTLQRVQPLVFGMIMSCMLMSYAGNTWVAATMPAVALIMTGSCVLGAFLTRKYAVAHGWLTYVEFIPSILVVKVAQFIGTTDHLQVMAVWYAVVLIVPFLGATLRNFRNSAIDASY